MMDRSPIKHDVLTECCLMLGHRLRRSPSFKKPLGLSQGFFNAGPLSTRRHSTKTTLGLCLMFFDHVWNNFQNRARILVQVTIYHRLLIGRDGHLDQSEAYDIS